MWMTPVCPCRLHACHSCAFQANTRWLVLGQKRQLCKELSCVMKTSFGPSTNMGVGRGGNGPLDFEILSKKSCFLNFEWEKANLTTFHHWKNPLVAPSGKDPSDAHVHKHLSETRYTYNPYISKPFTQQRCQAWYYFGSHLQKATNRTMPVNARSKYLVSRLKWKRTVSKYCKLPRASDKSVYTFLPMGS